MRDLSPLGQRYKPVYLEWWQVWPVVVPRPFVWTPPQVNR